MDWLDVALQWRNHVGFRKALGSIMRDRSVTDEDLEKWSSLTPDLILQKVGALKGNNLSTGQVELLGWAWSTPENRGILRSIPWDQTDAQIEANLGADPRFMW